MAFQGVRINGVLEINAFSGLTLTDTLVMGANPIQFTDATLVYDGAANILAQKNGTNAQILRVYNTSPTEWLELNWQATANSAVIRTAMSGGTARALLIRYGNNTNNAINIPIATSSPISMAGAAGSAVNATGNVDILAAVKTATSGTDIGLRIQQNLGPTATSTMVGYPLSIVGTVNYSNVTPGAGSYEAIRVAITETALPTGTNYLIRLLAGVAGTTEKFSVTNAGLTTWADAADLVFGSTTGTKIATATTQKLGFFNATPIVQPSAYTQTYATADKIHANLTSATLTDNTTGTANTTLEALTSGTVYATDVGAIRNNFADLAASNNAIIVDLTDLKQLVNSVIDDLQVLGLAG